MSRKYTDSIFNLYLAIETNIIYTYLTQLTILVKLMLALEKTVKYKNII